MYTVVNLMIDDVACILLLMIDDSDDVVCIPLLT